MLPFCYLLKLPFRSVRYCSNAVYSEFLKNKIVQNYFDNLQNKDNNFMLGSLIDERKEVVSCLKWLDNLEGTNDDAKFKMSLLEERKELNETLLNVEKKLLDHVIPPLVDSNKVIIEIIPGVGGQEAMLFAKDLYDMYINYINFKGWNIDCNDVGISDLNGVRHASFFVQGRNAFKFLKQESGIHRVQRVPSTERSGRIHTSTASVAVFLQPSEIDIKIDDKDLVIETKRSSGAGGQHVNKTESAVRITHIPTGISVECQTDRSQIKNRQFAAEKLRAKLYSLELNKRTDTMQESRKQQIGTRARSDKIRTYNFPKDRITDHRISKTIFGMETFLKGEELLDSLINELAQYSEKLRFEQFLDNLK